MKAWFDCKWLDLSVREKTKSSLRVDRDRAYDHILPSREHSWKGIEEADVPRGNWLMRRFRNRMRPVVWTNWSPCIQMRLQSHHCCFTLSLFEENSSNQWRFES
jgi:hypothetical protein